MSETESYTSTIWNLQSQQNPHFTGRKQLLADLEKRFNGNDRVQVIHGLGGVGKSQLATEYAYRHREQYGVIWWIRAESASSIETGLAKLAARLGRELPEDAPPELVRDTAYQLIGTRKFLIILDAAADIETVRAFLPKNPRSDSIDQSGIGHVLITSRNPSWTGIGTAHPLKVLDREESISFLHNRTGRNEAEAVSKRLADALGDLPLALEQAAACIAQDHISFTDYLQRFETEWAQLLQEGRRSVEFPNTVAMTWGLSFSAVERSTPEATNLMNLCSFLSTTFVAKKLIRDGAEFLPASLKRLGQNPLRLEGAIASLLKYSLLETDDRGISIHRLVATITRDRLEEDAKDTWCKSALSLVRGLFKFDSTNIRTWPECAEVLPHVLDVTQHAHRLEIAPDETADLLNDAGRYLLKKAQYHDARAVLERAMQIAEKRHGSKSPKLSSIANNLGRVLEQLGNSAEALKQYNIALAIDEVAYGHSHPHVAEVINNYGVSLQKMGDRDLARQQFEWAVQVFENHHGPDHPKLASILNNLGYSLMSSGLADAAQIQLLRALTIAEANLGPDHPTTARVIYNLASVSRAQGTLAVARDYLERALKIDEAALGPNHPEVGKDCLALADVMEKISGLSTDVQELRNRGQEIDSRVKAERLAVSRTSN